MGPILSKPRLCQFSKYSAALIYEHACPMLVRSLSHAEISLRGNLEAQEIFHRSVP